MQGRGRGQGQQAKGQTGAQRAQQYGQPRMALLLFLVLEQKNAVVDAHAPQHHQHQQIKQPQILPPTSTKTHPIGTRSLPSSPDMSLARSTQRTPGTCSPGACSVWACARLARPRISTTLAQPAPTWPSHWERAAPDAGLASQACRSSAAALKAGRCRLSPNAWPTSASTCCSTWAVIWRFSAWRAPDGTQSESALRPGEPVLAGAFSCRWALRASSRCSTASGVAPCTTKKCAAPGLCKRRPTAICSSINAGGADCNWRRSSLT